jgi:hypothetical protein
MAKKTTRRTPPARSRATRRSPSPRRTAARPRTRAQAATPPPDKPQLRHDELQVDRKPATRAGRRTGAGARRAGAARGATVTGAPNEARLRLQALEQVRAGAPGLGKVPGTVAAVTAGPPPTPPTPGISNWVQLGPITIPNGQTYSAARVQVTGRVTAIVVDPTNPQIIYIGAAQGGVWRTTDGGQSWTPLTDNEASLAIGALALDPGNPAVLYAGTGEGNFSGDSYYGAGVLKTTNANAATPAWTTLGASTFAGTRFSRIAVFSGASGPLLGATNLGVYRSTNGGTTWTPAGSGLPAAVAATDVAIDRTTSGTAYAGLWGNGIYKTTNANAAAPSWTKLTGGLPAGSAIRRIALGISPSSPSTLYALIADPAFSISYFFVTTNGGATWTSIPLPGGNLGGQGFYNLNVAVDPTTPDVVYISAISLWKAVRNTITGIWTITDVGGAFHPDNHAFAFDPTNHLVIYAGSDGGFYKSSDGGATWTDALNKGPCITQYEFLAQHPTTETVVFGGTQDNGTEQYRNHPAFHHADDGDGGCCVINQTLPAHVLSTYYGLSPKLSTQAGKFGSWTNESTGLGGTALFYPPLVADRATPAHVAIGATTTSGSTSYGIFLDGAEGTGHWPTKVALPGLGTDLVSAIDYVTDTLIYAATQAGKVYRLAYSGSWTAVAIAAPPLPAAFVWEIRAIPGSANQVVLVMSGFGYPHVWTGTVPTSGPAAWTSASTGLPDIPVNALVLDPTAPATTWYIGTDLGVWRTLNAGAGWTPFSDGLPNVAIFDLSLHAATRLLRAGTHGRGLWERRLDVTSAPAVELFVRDNLMDSGRFSPSPSGVAAAFEDPLQYVALGDLVYWWDCADVKVDSPTGTTPVYQLPVSAVDAVAFETVLQHRDSQRGRVNRIYVQVHNRGITAATNVTVKVLVADASAGLPLLQSDFWTNFPNDPSPGPWVPIGAYQTIPSLGTTVPAVLEWDWNTPLSAADHSCMLVVADCAADPIPAAAKVLQVWDLVPNERHVGQKNLHVIDALPGTYIGTQLLFHGALKAPGTLRLVTAAKLPLGLGMLLPKPKTKPKTATARGAKAAAAAVAGSLVKRGFTVAKPPAAMIAALTSSVPNLSAFDTSQIYQLEAGATEAALTGLTLPAAGLQTLVVVTVPAGTAAGSSTFTWLQQEAGRIVGGSTYVVRVASPFVPRNKLRQGSPPTARQQPQPKPQRKSRQSARPKRPA